MLPQRLVRLSLFVISLATLVIMLMTLSNIYIFQRLTDEKILAELEFRPLAKQQWLLFYRPADTCEAELMRFSGDQFRIDASFLKWHRVGNLLGLDARYRLDRIETRRTIGENSQTIDQIALSKQPWLGMKALSVLMWPLADTVYGSSAYADIERGRRYQVYRSQSGLVLRSEVIPPSIHMDGELRIEIRRGCDAEH